MTDLDYTDRQVTVNLDALGHNFRRARAMAGGGGRVMAVVKADAYGHGLEPTAQRLVAEGAAALGVGRLEEVERLRRAGLGLPMVILTGVLPNEAAAAVRLRSLPFVFTLDLAEAPGRRRPESGPSGRHNPENRHRHGSARLRPDRPEPGDREN